MTVSFGEKEPSLIGLDSLVQFTPSFQFGEERLTTAEINELIAQTKGLEFLKGKFHEKLQRVLGAYEQTSQLIIPKKIGNYKGFSYSYDS